MRNTKNSSARKRITFSLRPHRKILHTLLVLVGVVMLWDGVWTLVDLYIFPENALFRGVSILVLGFLLLYLPDQDLKELV